MTNQGIQEWTVPKSGTYTFQLAGAYGGNTGSAGGGGGGTGSGRIVNGSMPLTKGDVIAILVGQKGGGSSGGGGTFVWFKTSGTLILAAGGGGGSSASGTPNGNATAPASQTANGFQGTIPSSYNSISAVTGGPGEYKDNKSNYWDATQTAGWGCDGVVQFGGSATNTPSGYYTEHGQTDADNDNTFMIARSPLNGGQGAVHFMVIAALIVVDLVAVHLTVGVLQVVQLLAEVEADTRVEAMVQTQPVALIHVITVVEEVHIYLIPV